MLFDIVTVSIECVDLRGDRLAESIYKRTFVVFHALAFRKGRSTIY